jgi:hypothetical protein
LVGVYKDDDKSRCPGVYPFSTGQFFSIKDTASTTSHFVESVVTEEQNMAFENASEPAWEGGINLIRDKKAIGMWIQRINSEC